MRFSGKLAVLGFVLFIVGIIWKLFMGIPLGFWVTPPEGLVVEWWAFTVLHWAGLILFVISLIYYVWKGQKE